jgi:ATP-dependent DNA helicase HFM1/MER3
LEAGDFLAVADGLSEPKNPIKSLETPIDDLDWLSIDGSSSDSQGATENPQRQNHDWITDIEHLDDNGPEPIRLPNGNWACIHKCKDKTRYASLLVSSMILAEGNSCKHFCCREGLEKPPKPRKRAASNHKAGNLNQLTISAAIKKRDNSQNVRNGKQPAKQPPKLTTTKKVKSPLQSQFPKLPLERKISNRGKTGNKGTGTIKLSTSKTKGGKLNDQPQTVSSDFDDDGLDDLPPLSDILRGSRSGTAPEDPAAVEACQNEDNICENPFAGAKNAVAKDHPATVESLTTPNFPEIIVLSDDSTPEPGRDIFTNPEDIGSSIATAPLSASSGNIVLPATRKSSSFCRAYEARILQQAEISPFSKYLAPAPTVRRNLTKLEPMCAVDSVSKDHTRRTPTNSSSGWDDIDRMSWEEINDIINHY